MSENIRSVIRDAVDRKRMPAFNPGSIRDLAMKLGMSVPVSLLDLPKALNELLPAGVTYDSGRFAAGNVHASAQLYLQSDGGMLFSGQAHESGVVGDNFVLAMVLLDVKDAAGNALAFVHDDTLAGQLDVGFSDKEWHTPGFNQLVRDNWDAVKHTRVETRLHVSTDPWQVTELAIAGLVGVAVAIGGIFAVQCPKGEEYKCQEPRFVPRPNDDPNKSGIDMEIVCECRKKKF